MTVILPGAVHADDREDKAVNAAQTWLNPVDQGNYSQSWQQSADFFKTLVSKDKWVNALQRVRTPLGQIKSRVLMSADYKTEVPGAPDGHYVIIKFATSFENKQNSTETVTPVLDKDGKWRVAGYFIR
ncbi:MAG: DUF4019 domain-containing protein [Alphaproteobacteria bacterium]|nr:DUF4019 domain-containing protein [Alphaproteobacteria bacterium]MBT4965648.1 DUF4019 domain-containing protein [Alphaproteobacteria bacterium]MBT5159517.1 DUF4019 domain-containing protein [Alphaproteobacteria bacterium]MBT5917373.1 DUF4019 domain-containing protein [Alphaproteobacteria bacterium]MBT6386771.1 DUF4019 domain-containing protein [Alphaproteobacteria bacterium]